MTRASSLLVTRASVELRAGTVAAAATEPLCGPKKLKRTKSNSCLLRAVLKLTIDARKLKGMPATKQETIDLTLDECERVGRPQKRARVDVRRATVGIPAIKQETIDLTPDECEPVGRPQNRARVDVGQEWPKKVKKILVRCLHLATVDHSPH